MVARLEYFNLTLPNGFTLKLFRHWHSLNMHGIAAV
jgi:hypothetical protein